MTVLRIYDPQQCDASGVPLDWERCRNGCTLPKGGDPRDCPGGHMLCTACYCHGSLKAAALDACFQRAVRANAGKVAREGYPRCEDCGHPMSEGTWEPPATDPERWLRSVFAALRAGREVTIYGGPLLLGEKHLIPVHYSPCDEGCEHGGPGRADGQTITAADVWQTMREYSAMGAVEASWRPVDVRCLGWAHDLRPEKLAVLCLRCWVARG